MHFFCVEVLALEDGNASKVPGTNFKQTKAVGQNNIIYIVCVVTKECAITSFQVVVLIRCNTRLLGPHLHY